MEPWLKAALDYIPRWLEFQLRATERPGMAVAIQHRQRTVLDQAWGPRAAGGRKVLTAI